MIQIFFCVLAGILCASICIEAHETKAERRKRRESQRWVRGRYGKTY